MTAEPTKTLQKSEAMERQDSDVKTPLCQIGRLPVLNKRDSFSESVFSMLLSNQPTEERESDHTAVTRMCTVKCNHSKSTCAAVGKLRALRAPQLVLVPPAKPEPEPNSTDEDEGTCSTEKLQKRYGEYLVYVEQLEAEERSEIEHLMSEVQDVTLARYAAEADTLLSRSTYDAQMADSGKKLKDAATEVIARLFLDKMKAFARAYYALYFSRGIQSTSLTPISLTQLCSALILVDPLLADRDLNGFVFPVGNVRMSLETSTTEDRVMVLQFLSVKAQCLYHCVEDNMEDYRQYIVDYFYDQDLSAIPKKFQRAVLLMYNAISLDCETSGFPIISTEFYKYMIEMEAAQSSYQSDCTIQVQYQKGECAGRGKFGAVYRCVNIRNGKFLALKELPLPPTKKGEKQVVSEINMMKLLLHDNVISFYGCRIDREERNVSILMDYCPKSLRNVVDEHNGLSMKLIAHYARQALQGLVYLHENHIIHRDIKAANVMVTESGTIKLSDFGTALLSAMELAEETSEEDDASFARSLGPRQKTEDLTDTLFEERMQERLRKDRMGAKEACAGLREVSSGADLASYVAAHGGKGIVGTPLFMAPEVLRGLMPSQSSDVWAFGCMMIELVTGRYPWSDEGFESMALPQVMYNIGKTSAPPQIPNAIAVGDKFPDFLSCCLQVDYTKRWTAKQLLEHPFLQKDSLTVPGNSSSLTGTMLTEDSLKVSSPGISRSTSSHGDPEERSGEVLPPAVQRSREPSTSSGGSKGNEPALCSFDGLDQGSVLLTVESQA